MTPVSSAALDPSDQAKQTKMKSQKPAEGITRMNSVDSEYPRYRVSCHCGSEDHSHDVFVEAEDDCVVVTVYTTETTDFWTNRLSHDYNRIDHWSWRFVEPYKNLVNALYRRCQLTWQLWTRGYVKYQADLVLTRQAAINYADALKNAVRDIDQSMKKSG